MPDRPRDDVDRAAPHGVELVRWPSEAALRDRLARGGIPRLLLVESEGEPPPAIDVDEDWVRLPVADRVLDARTRRLARSAAVLEDARPWIDEQRNLHRGPATVALSPAEAIVAGALLASPGTVIDRGELARRLWPGPGPPSAKAVDAVVYRLRRRVGAIHLHVRAVRSRGFVLDL